MVWIKVNVNGSPYAINANRYVRAEPSPGDRTSFVLDSGVPGFIVDNTFAEVLAMLSAPAPAVEVTDAMVQNATAAYLRFDGLDPWSMRAALIAALTPEKV